MRRAVAILTLVLVTSLMSMGVANAQAAPVTSAATIPTSPALTSPGPTLESVPDNCVGHSIGEPECGVKPKDAGDRGGYAQLALFGLVLGGMAVIFFVIVRSTRARGRAEGSS
jgi:hypothetical protein